MKSGDAGGGRKERKEDGGGPNGGKLLESLAPNRPS